MIVIYSETGIEHRIYMFIFPTRNNLILEQAVQRRRCHPPRNIFMGTCSQETGEKKINLFAKITSPAFSIVNYMHASRWQCFYNILIVRNETFLEHKSRGTQGLVQLKCSMGRKEGYISDVYHVGNHSRPTSHSAYVIFNFK